MQTSELFQSYISANNFTQASRIEADLISQANQDTKPQNEIDTSEAIGLFLAAICFTIAWTILLYIGSGAYKFIQKRNRILAPNSQQFPCKKCRFFNNSNHLKCAVHPSTVLTEEALNCPDYFPK